VSTHPTPRETLLELLATRATDGLLPTEEARLATLLHAEPDLEPDYFELAAASVDLAVDAPLEAHPSALGEQILAGGLQWAGAQVGAQADLGHTGDDWQSDAPREVEPSRVAAEIEEPIERVVEPSASQAAQDQVAQDRATRDPATQDPATQDLAADDQAGNDREPPTVVSFRREEPIDTGAQQRRGFDWTRWAGWGLAAAMAGFTVGMRFLTPPVDTPPEVVVAQEPASQQLSAGQRKAELESTAGDLRRVAWTPTDHPLGTNVTGEVVWSDLAQEGYMTFRGLAWNDPTQRQYQLWVFDSGRSAERPVDGGVFDVPASASEVIIPIDAKLRVDEATLFAITLERPGGVVVSSREDLVLLGPVA